MFQALLRQAREQGAAKFLAQPRIHVLDNQTGFIQSGGQYPCPSPTADGRTQIEMVPVGVTARVTPRISPDGKVLMRVEVTHTQPTPQPVDLGNGLTAPVFNKESVETTVCLLDGATAVLGAGTQTHKVAQEVRTPIMSDIPCVGRLFTDVGISTERTELLLAVTPHIVRDRPAAVTPPARATPTAPVVMPPRRAPAPPFPVPGTVMLPYPATAAAVATPVGLVRPAAPMVAPAPVAVTTPSPRPTPACCEAACGACDKAKAAELVKAYHKACAAGDKDAATRCAVQALAIDPTCFGTAPAK
jgi:hypothetical protein